MIEKTIERWRRHAQDEGFVLNPGASPDQLDAFEERYHVRLTDELRTLYLSFDGSVDWNRSAFRVVPLAEVERSDTPNHGPVFLFAEHCVWAVAWGVRLGGTRLPNAPVVELGAWALLHTADSFDQFLSLVLDEGFFEFCIRVHEEGRPETIRCLNHPNPRVDVHSSFRLRLIQDATDDDLEVLSEFPDVSDLHLAGSRISDVGLVRIAALGKLSSLDLSATPVTDLGLIALSRLGTLQTLHIENTQVTDAGIEHLVVLPALRSLHLEGTRITNASLDTLSRLPALHDCSPYSSVWLDLQSTAVEFEAKRAFCERFPLVALIGEGLTRKRAIESRRSDGDAIDEDGR